MNNIALAARIIDSPSEKYNEQYRFWQGCPTVLSTSKGKLYAGWYSGGTKEPSEQQYNLLVSSDDGGMSWSDPILVIDSIPEEKLRMIDIQLWLDPLERMWLFWTVRNDNYLQKSEEHLGTWAIICEDPDTEKLQWSEPHYIAPGFLRCQPTALSDGRYVLCAYNWTRENYCYSESLDQGITWSHKEAGKKVNTPFDETMILERKDNSLWMLARSSEKCLAETVSFDGGKNWSDGVKTKIAAPSSRFFLRRLPSGRILLIYNSDPEMRQSMTAMLSEDEGKTWKYSLLLDEAEPTSYPDAAFMPDGSIYIVYDHGRNTFKEIVAAQITENDIMAGKLVNNSSYLKKIISKAPAQPFDEEVFEKQSALDTKWWANFKEINNLE